MLASRIASPLPALLSALLAAGTVAACTGEYRSMDRQVLDSPLVFVGTIESVEARASANYRRKEGKGEPQIAIVRVTQVLKGSWQGKTIRVSNGPVHG